MNVAKSSSGFVEYIYDSQLIAMVAEEDTCVGFLLAGIGQRTKKNELNFAVVGDDATQEEIMGHMNRFILREDIAIILVTYGAAAKIKNFLLEYESFLPVILEIPSKYHPYDPAEDFIMTKLIDKYSEDEQRRPSLSKS
ncbi:V-type proton ATPase subunit F-like [Coccinella septempunctata]|uniref:V-type proton ATPase subunit F-like n=1 Tax=Coccinella septempunctata TaxID=41139 RepID=UPI001D08AABA|nr:V-type proton ATPase subunit F-like [Coccinella septempunctata]